jgi:hypothetical protein
MKIWVWPINWYQRIRELEAEVAALRAQNTKLDAMFRASAIHETALTSAYVASVSGLATMMTAELRLRQERSQAAAMAEYERQVKIFEAAQSRDS